MGGTPTENPQSIHVRRTYENEPPQLPQNAPRKLSQQNTHNKKKNQHPNHTSICLLQRRQLQSFKRNYLSTLPAPSKPHLMSRVVTLNCKHLCKTGSKPANWKQLEQYVYRNCQEWFSTLWSKDKDTGRGHVDTKNNLRKWHNLLQSHVSVSDIDTRYAFHRKCRYYRGLNKLPRLLKNERDQIISSQSHLSLNQNAFEISCFNVTFFKSVWSP